ncbi:hypothetical protein [Georgenia sp. H159]|uniref:hypothetical protein n=1 Tax=Georgenia sp. H159 TaxID=3076115 RepID=UPI002D792262|nr:hypothetical protein [Georgenia sp. H159]
MIVQTWEQVRVETDHRRERLTRAWGRSRRSRPSRHTAGPARGAAAPPPEDVAPVPVRRTGTAPLPAPLALEDAVPAASEPSVRRAAA